MKSDIQIPSYKLLSEYPGRHRARVFQAVDTRTGEPCAVKIIAKTALRLADVGALRTEFERLAGCQHPHLLRVKDFGEDARAVWLISGYPLARD